MDTSNSISAAQYSAGLSILKSANKQPELALQLLMQTLTDTQAPLQTPVGSTTVSAAPDGTGQRIDITA